MIPVQHEYYNESLLSLTKSESLPTVYFKQVSLPSDHKSEEYFYEEISDRLNANKNQFLITHRDLHAAIQNDNTSEHSMIEFSGIGIDNGRAVSPLLVDTA
jgi:hypothetical protein